MIPVSNFNALSECHPRYALFEIQDSIRNLSLIFQIVTPKVAGVEVLGGIDR